MAKDLTSRKVGRVIFVYIALFLCVVFAVSVFTLSKYSVTNEGVDSASVAAFVPGNFNLEFIIDKLAPNMAAKEYDFQVTNSDSSNVSQTDMTYTIELSFYGDLPLEYSLYYVYTDINNNEVTQELTATNGIYSAPINFTAGFIATHEYRIVVNWAENETDIRYMDEVGYLEVTVVTMQAD